MMRVGVSAASSMGSAALWVWFPGKLHPDSYSQIALTILLALEMSGKWSWHYMYL